MTPPLQLAVAILIATGVPGISLFIIYTLDLYASRSFRLVMVCFVWGAIGGLGLSWFFNTYVAVPLIQRLALNTLFLYVLFAPVAEELLKSLAFVHIAQRPEFTYFVDGAIYGFAIGIGFSIVENYLYVIQNPGQAIGVALVRAFSTSLMHGTAAGLVGMAIGRSRFQRGSSRNPSMLWGWVAAILLHGAFNGVTRAGLVSEGLGTLLSVGTGICGVGLIAFFIRLGLREQKRWIAETLDRKMGVTASDLRATLSLDNIDEVLEPIAQLFPAQSELVKDLLVTQAQLGIKQKVYQETEDRSLRDTREQEISDQKEAMEQLKRDIGPYVMVFVRAVFPEGTFDLWGRLESQVTVSGPADPQRWSALLTNPSKAAEKEKSSIFSRLEQTRHDES